MPPSRWPIIGRRGACLCYGSRATLEANLRLMETRDLYRIVHLIPFDGVGGVEEAARSLREGRHGTIEIHKCFIAGKGGILQGGYTHNGPYRSVNHPMNYISCLSFLHKLNPDLIIVSLWRSCIVYMLLKVLRPRLKGVIFLHCAQASNTLDRALNWLAIHLSREIWADSAATMAARVPPRRRQRSRIISFVTERRPEPSPGDPLPDFIYWGRLHRQKGLDQALHLFASIQAKLPQARFTIIGPDGGEGSRLRELAAALGIEGRVSFLGARPSEEIRRLAADHSFYLQLSRWEGMAMSVVEAMQSGLVPIVTPVGEIARYCRDGEDSILYRGDQSAVIARVEDLMDNPASYASMSRAAWARWSDKSLYREDVLATCQELVARA